MPCRKGWFRLNKAGRTSRTRPDPARLTSASTSPEPVLHHTRSAARHRQTQPTTAGSSSLGSGLLWTISRPDTARVRTT